jgi:hypothetical protein
LVEVVGVEMVVGDEEEGYGTDGFIYLPRLGSSDTSII